MNTYDDKILGQELSYIDWDWERLNDGTYQNSKTGEKDKKDPSWYTNRTQMEHNARALAQKWGRNKSSAFKKRMSKNKDTKVYQHEVVQSSDSMLIVEKRELI